MTFDSYRRGIPGDFHAIPYDTIAVALREQVSRSPDVVALQFVESTRDPVSMTFAELDRAARAVAVALLSQARPRDRVLLVYPPGLEYVVAYFGTLYAGMVPVPVYPPDPARMQRMLPRLRGIAVEAEVAVVATCAFVMQFKQGIAALAPDLGAMNWLATDRLSLDVAGDWREPDAGGDDLALLQYTSGSTSEPKGVMVSNANLLANIRAITQKMALSPVTRHVSWLPLYHDMGLIGGLITPMLKGIPITLCSPMTFLKDPAFWLRKIAELGVTNAGAPNFGYEHCVRKVKPEDLEGLDFSPWNVAFCGAEPIRFATVSQFSALLAGHGFHPEAFFPVYGLAESTLLVTAPPWGERPLVRRFERAGFERDRAVPAEGDDASTIELVSCGAAMPASEVAIVDPQTLTRLEDYRIGEIWLRGPSVARGYWKRPEATASAFDQTLGGEGGYLRSGDLGFLVEGNLFVTGRIKDLITIGGLNRYPQDIEISVEGSSQAIRPGGLAAFAVDDGSGETLAVVAEFDRRRLPDRRTESRGDGERRQDPEGASDLPPSVSLDHQEAIDAIARAITAEHQIQVDRIVLVKPGTIPKTTSGKIQRRAVSLAMRDGSLDVLHDWRRGKPS